LPEAVAAGRLGGQVRRLPEPAEGDHEDARPAGRRAPAAAAACRRPGGAPRDPRGARRVRPRARARRGVSSFRGVDHVGVGVADMDAALRFYGQVGFDDVLFDYTGDVPGPDRRARVVMLDNGGATPVGPGRIKLVEVLDGDGPPPAPTGGGWGELGICEICLHARGVDGVHEQLVAAGAESLMEPLAADVQPNAVTLDIAYVADPWQGKLELIEWTGLWKSLPGPPRAEGVNHVAFGVVDIDR